MKSNYQDLEVWQLSFEIGFKVYKLSQFFPKQEAFGITSQMRRSALSISSNIAEGKGRGSDKDFARFLYIAKGSCNELESQLMMALRLEYCSNKEAQEIFDMIKRVLKMLVTFIQKLHA